MKRMNQLIGLPVLMQTSGKKVGIVERVCLYADGQLVQGVIVALDGLGRRRRYVPERMISLMGDVSVLVQDLLPLPKALRARDTDSRVLGTAGDMLGWMTDAMIDESNGRVCALEVSMGYVDDLTRGRIWVHDFTLRPCGVIAVSRESGGESPG